LQPHILTKKDAVQWSVQAEGSKAPVVVGTLSDVVEPLLKVLQHGPEPVISVTDIEF
jgi:hypothetical protein